MPGSIDTAFAVGALRSCVLFARCSDATLEQCATQLRVRRFRRNDTVFHQGDPGDSLYIIESGTVKVVLPSPEGEEGAIIASLGRGAFFGELALLDGAPHSASVVALDQVDALVLHREQFDELIDTDPELRRALLAGLTAELRRLTRHVEDLHFLDLPGRLARRLLDLAAEAAPGQQVDVRLSWPYTQSDLAAMIGGTRQTVNRLLADLVDQDLIAVEKDAIVIRDVARLEQAAER